MTRKLIALLLAMSMSLTLLPGLEQRALAEGGSYTYHGTYSSVSTWSPTDWEISSEYDMLGYTVTPFYGFWMNETKDGYDIVPELAADFPVDVTAAYAGNEVYGVPADAAEGYAWQITMNPNAAWEDGTPITARDVEYTLQQFLNPAMKNYRASLFYQGGTALANAEGYYNSDKAGAPALYLATSLTGKAMSDFTPGENGQYVDAHGLPAFFAWNAPLEYLGGYTLRDYWSYMDLNTFYAVDALMDADGLVPMTDETIAGIHSLTGSDAFYNETVEELINYVYCYGVMAPTAWEQVGFVADGPYTFTLVLKNPSTLFDFEMNVDNLLLVKEDLYEANKVEAGGIIKSAYGTGVDRFSSYGPYRITSYQESKQIVFERNESWFGYSDERYEGMYQTTGVALQQIDEHTTQLSLFLQGNLDAVGLAADDMEKYGTSDYVYYTPTSNTYYLALNTDFDILRSRETAGVNKTILTYIDFRKAMSLSFDRTDYVMSCTACSDPAFGLLNSVYVCDPVSGLAYRDSEYAQQTLCEVYGVDSVDDLTGYNRDEAARLLQSAYDQCLADGNIADTDTVEIEYHVYSTDSANQKMVDYIEDAMLAAAAGTSLEGRIKFRLVEDQDYYNTMQSGQDDMINGAWGGAEMDPYSMMICWTDPNYIMEYGFDPYQDLTISVQGADITMSYYDWYNELYNGAYAIAELDVRNEILAGMEKGLLLNYHMIPIFSSCGAALASQRIVYGSEDYINSIVGRGGIQFLTYTMDDDEWASYCTSQGHQLSY